ncbi:hypothetical protein [Streptomyces sp. NBC_00158]|uniref:hypothetical protein n=1 Tax=Streptomyces sp. NBC_00158 TaxID=2903627 RepID=UPI00324DFD04
MTGQAWVGDEVRDPNGHTWVVTDVRASKTWVLRPLSGGLATQHETDDPDSLEVLVRREHRTQP